MDRITIVIRDSGKTIKAVFDGEGNCISGSPKAVNGALELLSLRELRSRATTVDPAADDADTDVD